MADFGSIWHALHYWGLKTPAGSALRCGEKRVDYSTLLSVAESRAQWLADRGVALGDRVVVVGYNSVDWIVAYLAAMRLGAIVVPVNNRLSQIQMAELTSLLGASIALTDGAHRPLFGKSNIQIHELEHWEPPRREPLPALPEGQLPALISFTSGTTGQPKGAVLSVRGLYEASATFQRYFGTGEQDSTLVLAPLFHNTGFVDQFGQMLIAGGETILLPEFHRKEAIAAFRVANATFVTAVPSVLRMLMLTDDADVVFGTARMVLFGGSPMPAAWSRELLDRWPHLKLVHGYGLTEFGSACSFLPADMVTEFGESVGYAAPGVTLRIVGDDGSDVEPGAVGEIWASGPTRMIEYWRRPDATAEKISGDWLRTGDLGHVDTAGRIYLSGRRDDVINRGGEKILPSHLESLLADRPDVANCAVVGVPDPVLQQVPVAAIEVRPAHAFDEVRAKAHLAAHLPAYAVPQHYFVFDQLPRIASGKIDRRETRAMVIALIQGKQPTGDVNDPQD